MSVLSMRMGTDACCCPPHSFFRRLFSSQAMMCSVVRALSHGHHSFLAYLCDFICRIFVITYITFKRYRVFWVNVCHISIIIFSYNFRLKEWQHADTLTAFSSERTFHYAFRKSLNVFELRDTRSCTMRNHRVPWGSQMHGFVLATIIM